MSDPSMSDMLGRPQAGPSSLVTVSDHRVTLGSNLNVRRTAGQWAARSTSSVREHASHFTQRGIIASTMLGNEAGTHPVAQTGTETIKVLLVCLAVLIAIIVSMVAALLWKTSGQTMQSAILKGGATFAGTFGVLILLMHSIGLV